MCLKCDTLNSVIFGKNLVAFNLWIHFGETIFQLKKSIFLVKHTYTNDFWFWLLSEGGKTLIGVFLEGTTFTCHERNFVAKKKKKKKVDLDNIIFSILVQIGFRNPNHCKIGQLTKKLRKK